MATVETNIKDEARRIVDQLPNNATWQDLMYQIYVRERMEAGLRDLEAGNWVTTEELRKDLGLDK